jgi:hypothetical protein
LDSQDPAVLWRVAPGFVVVYDADLAFLRQLEVYQVGQCYMTCSILWCFAVACGAWLCGGV